MSRDRLRLRHLLVPLFPGFALVEPHFDAALHVIYICPRRVSSPCNAQPPLCWKIERISLLGFGAFID